MRVALALALVLWAAAAAPEPLAEGSVLAPLSLRDQFGEARAIDGSVRAILFARDMDGGGVLREALGDTGADLLARTRSVYVADVSGMPAMVRRLFALPSLRRRGYPVLLDEDGKVTASFPGSDKQATLIELRELRITRVRHFAATAELRTALEALAAP